MANRMRVVGALLAALAAAAAANAQAPQKVGQCVTTTVAQVGTRLGGADTGSMIVYANGLRQVSFIAVAGIDASKPGDTVKLCLVQLPKDCPAGDDRGRIYTGANQRTHQTWRESDSDHACGGA